MSFHRENVIWQSKNKTWNIGFWSFYETGDRFDEDYDPEWDVEYRNDEFWFVATGQSSPDAAADAYRREHGNPGGHWQVEHSADTAEECARYDDLAWEFKHPKEAEARRTAKFEAERTAKHTALIADFDARGVTNFTGIEWTVARKPSHNWALMSQTARAALGTDGWVSIDGKPVYNPTKREFAADVVDFKQVPPRRRNHYGW